MVLVSVEVDAVDLFMRPHQVIQRMSLKALQERQRLIDSVKGEEWRNSTSSGKVVDCCSRSITVELEDGSRKELGVTGARLRQMFADTTTRK